MLQKSSIIVDSFKEHYHRINLPRRIALRRYIQNEQVKQKKKGQISNVSTNNTVEIPYKYNRWWVSNDHQFVHQHAYVQDPDVVKERRNTLPVVTSENIWKEPQKTYFMPFAPYVKVVDYAKDADAKFLKPVNIPRWKDYMMRSKPVIPRTWY